MKGANKVLLNFLFISLITMGCFGRGNHGWQFDEWIEFKKEIKKDYEFIQETRIYGTSPTLFISFDTDKKLNKEEIIRLFEEVRGFLFSEEIFIELSKYHHELYGGTTTEVHIIFGNTEVDDTFYDFYSASEDSGTPQFTSFKTWYLEYDEVREKYVPKVE